jgi:hypothetical protein
VLTAFKADGTHAVITTGIYRINYKINCILKTGNAYYCSVQDFFLPRQSVETCRLKYM